MMNTSLKSFAHLLAIVLTVLLLTGCSISGLKKNFEGQLDKVVKQDQEHEQGFLLNSEDVYAAFDESINTINLRGKGLTAIPDFCELLEPLDYIKVWRINLADNDIKIVNVDLSCLTYLKSLNLSYNDIQLIQFLGDLPALQDLQLQKNQLETIEGLPEMPTLEKLNLGYNKLKDVKGLEDFKNLIVLELQHNVLESLVGVEKLKQLQELKVEFNKLKDGDLSSLLEKLENLELFSAKGNQIKNALIGELEKLNEKYLEKYLGSGKVEGDMQVLDVE